MSISIFLERNTGIPEQMEKKKNKPQHHNTQTLYKAAECYNSKANITLLYKFKYTFTKIWGPTLKMYKKVKLLIVRFITSFSQCFICVFVNINTLYKSIEYCSSFITWKYCSLLKSEN